MKFWELSDNLTRMGHRVIVFAPKVGQPRKQTSAQVIEIPAIGIPILGVFLYEILLFLFSILALLRIKCDVVYVRIMSSLVPLTFSFFSASPMILEVNDDPFLRYRQAKGIEKIKLPIVKLCDKINFKFSGKIIAVSDKVKNAIVQEAEVPEPKIIVVQSGANIELFRQYDKNESRAALGLDASKRYVGFVGSYNPNHDYNSLIKSAKIVTDLLPDVRYLIVGNGGWQTIEIPKIITLGLEKFFVFCGYIDYKEAPRYIASADICLAPILKRFGDTAVVKIFDYLSCGRPVIATKFNAEVDYLTEGGCVILVPPEDPQALAQATLDLLSNPQKMEEMGKNGRRVIAERYSRMSVAEKIFEIAKGLKGLD